MTFLILPGLRQSSSHIRSLINLFLFLSLALLFACRGPGKNLDWTIYRGDEGSNAYSPLDQINKSNVDQLKPAWTYRAGRASENTTLECNPLIIDGVLYGLSPTIRAFALDAKTGEELWVFNPFEEDHKQGGFYRGLTFWSEGDEKRLFMSAGHRLIALDPTTGKQIESFGDSGFVDLKKGLHDGKEREEDIKNTSPGIIYRDLIIVGSVTGEEYESSPGHIRAYDVRTGTQRWIFHTVPQPGEYGYDTWKNGNESSGGCNAWSGLSIDSKRGIVFAATGSPTFDFHGGERIGKNLFGNSVLAINASTGKLIWHYQTLHHDIWDYDLPAPPNLVTIQKDGKSIDAVIQLTKQGYVFFFDRETGELLYPVEEKSVAASKMPGEESWPTQPVPAKPPALGRHGFDENEITNISKASHDYVLELTKKFSWGDIYTPPAPEGLVQMPGMRGGAEWSGGCVDLETNMMYVGINNIANVVEMEERKEDDPSALSEMTVPDAGQFLYQKSCAVCHGLDRGGNGAFPNLVNIGERLKPSEIRMVMNEPTGRMPSFKALPEGDKDAIIAFLLGIKEKKLYKPLTSKESESKVKAKRYRMKAYNFLKDENGYPGTTPPWGTLNALDLNTAEIKWSIPLGAYSALTARGIPPTGTQLFGGGIVTAGGLIFIAATADEKFRALDKRTGKILWEYQLPCGGYATPSTYSIDGRQYVIIAAGGGGSQATRTGDYYIAFALPWSP
jgi:quinoprotein glucose dehydrogenase